MFESTRTELLARVRDDLDRGAVFYDLYREAPAILDVFAASVKDGKGQTIHRKLFVVESSSTNEIQVRQPTVFLDLNPSSKKYDIPNSEFIPDKPSIERYLYETALTPFLKEVESERSREIETIKHHVEISLNELINRQNLIVAGFLERQERGEELSGLISQAETRLDELNDRLEGRREDLEKEKKLVVSDITHLGRAMVLPHPDRKAFSMVTDAEVERIAMEKSMVYEEEGGWDPRDVSEDNRGFDILSRDPKNGSARFIEVKGRAGIGEIMLTKNELDTARRLGKDYWLYVVFDCASKPHLVRIKDPARLQWNVVISIEHYQVSAIMLQKEAETEGAKQ